jgi:cytochrome c biogenesis protein CcmG/thiol:disulfide interchange protein DsbE
VTRTISLAKRLFLILCALASLTGAFLLVLSTGLPERAEFTGRIIPGELPIAPELNAVAPPFSLPTLSNENISLYSLRGKPVVINFWATWCEPCRIEMPALQAIYETYAEQGLRLLAVNLGEPASAIRAWVQQLGLTFDVLLDEPQSTFELYQLRGQPSTYIVSPSGVITHIFYGPLEESTLRGLLAAYFVN